MKCAIPECQCSTAPRPHAQGRPPKYCLNHTWGDMGKAERRELFAFRLVKRQPAAVLNPANRLDYYQDGHVHVLLITLPEGEREILRTEDWQTYCAVVSALCRRRGRLRRAA